MNVNDLTINDGDGEKRSELSIRRFLLEHIRI